jgi:IclR family acetate operon transcriptional repressor
MRSVKTALQVLEAVSRLQPVGLSELARAMGLPKTTVFRSLATLAEAGWLETDGTQWLVSARAFVVGSTVGDRGGLRSCALPVMNALAAEVRETIHLMIPDGREVVLIERIDSPHMVRAVAPLGARAPLHASSNGKSVLAYLPEGEAAEYLRSDIAAVTAHTTTDPGLLRAELDTIRARGYAVSVEELQDGVVAVAAAIRPGGGLPIGSLSISGPKVRMPAEIHAEYGEKVRQAAEKIAAKLPAAVWHAPTYTSASGAAPGV